MPDRRTLTPAQIAEYKRRIIRIELTTGIGCALIGAVFLAGGHTLRLMSIFLFGWAIGCAFHLIFTLFINRLPKPRDRKHHDIDDP